MVKNLTKAISDLQFGIDKPFLCDTFNDVETIRASLNRWKKRNIGCSFKTRTEQTGDKYVIFVTKYDSPRD